MGNHGIYETYIRKNLSPMERRAVLLQYLTEVYVGGHISETECQVLYDEAIIIMGHKK